MPGLLLLPLVEQAVSGAAQAVHSSTLVGVTAGRGDNGRSLVVTVRGHSRGSAVSDKAPEADLSAVRQRIAAHYGAAGSLVVRQTTHGFNAVLTIPLVQAPGEDGA